MNGSDKNLDELIQSVASKGGTTEAALQILNTNKVSENIVSALMAAEKRAKELANS
jgi:pyrroline-5-carboxylate reductase